MDSKDARNAGRPQRVTLRTGKVGHKKTRTGCLTCRHRKVKCDEGSPQCYNCSRLQLHCVYPERTHKSGASSQVKIARSEPNSSPEAIPLPNLPRDVNTDLMDASSDAPPIQDRMALRLLHAWMSKGLSSHHLAALSNWRSIWLIEVPELALTHDYLLYALLAFSATQVSGSTGPDPELAVARYRYWSLALSSQQEMVSRNSSADVEPVTFAALLISMNAFAMLRDREIEPYVPPLEWLEVSKGFYKLCPDRETIDGNTSLAKMIDGTEAVWSPVQNGELGPIHPIYQPILNQYSMEDAFGDMETYEEVLSQVSSIREAIRTGEPGYYHVRRICIFAQMIPRRFIQFLKERRARALVVLAAFFAVVAHSDALVYFGDVNKVIPQREVHSIARILSQDWKGYMVQILDEVSEG